MKKKDGLNKGVVKGGPSGFLISLLVHAAAFLIAGMFVVFTVVQKDEKKFVPPTPVERPKMNLKKPKIQIKKASKPKSSTRIVTKVKQASMPDIQLPELSGMGDSLAGGGMSGIELLPDLTQVSSPFGDAMTTGSDLKGHFYNFNRGLSGKPRIMSPNELVDLLYSYMNADWKDSKLKSFYRSPKPLYTPAICVPTVMSELAPKAFGETTEEGYCWAVLYEGQLVYPEDITFRFWGVGDKIMAVNVAGETVLICAYDTAIRARFSNIWQTNDPKDNTYYFGEHRARPSDWITLKAGEPQDIKILISDLRGGLVYHMLSVEVEGEKYPLDRAGGGPTFPVFRTSEISRDMRDAIYQNLYPGDICLTNGPIFRDYVSKQSSAVAAEPIAPPPPPTPEPPASDDGLRVWTTLAGETLEARLRTVIGNEVLLEREKRKKQIKVPFSELIPEDREYIQLAMPPKFNIDFTKASKQIPNPPVSKWLKGGQRPLQMFSYEFGARIKQTSTGSYPYPIMVECFAVGDEVDADNYVLLDHITSSFVPSQENNRSHEIKGKPVEIMRIAYRASAPMRGTKYGGYLVTLTDKNGTVIAYDASHEFLFENIERLKKLKPGNHFDRECNRTIPARPNEDSRGSGAINGN